MRISFAAFRIVAPGLKISSKSQVVPILSRSRLMGYKSCLPLESASSKTDGFPRGFLIDMTHCWSSCLISCKISPSLFRPGFVRPIRRCWEKGTPTPKNRSRVHSKSFTLPVRTSFSASEGFCVNLARTRFSMLRFPLPSCMAGRSTLCV